MPRSPLEPIEYPGAKRGDVVDVYHGVSVPDPYRWLEDLDSPETRVWIEQQNVLTDSFLERIPQRAAIRERLRKIWNHERTGIPRRAGNRLIYSRNDGLQQHDVVHVLDDVGAEPRVLLDPNLLSSDGTVGVFDFDASPDGRYLAYGVSDAGSDWLEIRIRDIASGRDFPDRVLWAKFFSMAWRNDGTGFYYSRYEPPDPDTARKVQSLDQQIYFHAVGTSPDDDVLTFRRADQPKWMYVPFVTDGDGYLLLRVFFGDRNENLLLVKDLTRSDDPSWIQLFSERHALFHAAGSVGSRVFFVTDDSAPLQRIVAIDLADPSALPVEIVPESEDRLEEVRLIGGRLVCSYLHHASNRIILFDLDGQCPQELSLPGLGSAGGFSGRNVDTETYFAFTNVNTPSENWRLDLATGAISSFSRPTIDFDRERFVTNQVFVQSKDGTRVPMFLTHRGDIPLDGGNACLLGGYGGFNVPQKQAFSAPAQVWMEMGGIWATACLRGGGEYGREWHQAGTRLQKQNVFDDFIACAEWLIEESYTSRERLAIYGRSNGGLLVGACMTQRPDLFGACLPNVGVLDMLRYRSFTIGWAWESDYGSVDDQAELEALLAYSPLHNVRTISYPPTLIGTADHDDRVYPAHSFKFAAAVQAAQAGTNPVLLRVETRAGHGAGKPTSMLIEEWVDRWAFLAWALGMQDEGLGSFEL